MRASVAPGGAEGHLGGLGAREPGLVAKARLKEVVYHGDQARNWAGDQRSLLATWVDEARPWCDGRGLCGRATSRGPEGTE